MGRPARRERAGSGAALTTAVDAYNADLQVAQALQAKADKKLTKLNKARARCDVSSMPNGCQREYTQYDAVIDNATRGAASNVAVEQAIAAEQDALQRGSRTDYNNAVRDQNAAVAQSNDIGNDYNITVLPALRLGDRSLQPRLIAARSPGTGALRR